MTDPATLEEYNDRALASQRITGHGLDVTTHVPCPGCAAPGWLAIPITAALDDYAGIQDPADCAECGRTFRMVVTLEDGGAAGGGTTSFTITQTAGPPIPSYLPPMDRSCEP